jgi:hypothetical protein
LGAAWVDRRARSPQHYGCHVIGIDLTHDYIEAGNVLSGWLHLKDRVSLQQDNALALPFADGFFAAAYMSPISHQVRPG